MSNLLYEYIRIFVRVIFLMRIYSDICSCQILYECHTLLEISSSFSEFHFCHQCQLPPASLLKSTPSISPISPNRLSIALNSCSVLKKHETTPRDQKRAMLVTPLWGYFPARNYLAFPACPDQHVKTRFNMQRLSPPCWLTSCVLLPPISLKFHSSTISLLPSELTTLWILLLLALRIYKELIWQYGLTTITLITELVLVFLMLNDWSFLE